MDDKIYEWAKHFAPRAAQDMYTYCAKLPLQLPESRKQATARLLSYYIAAVEARNREFQMDAATTEKLEKVIQWMYDTPKRGLLLIGTVGNGKTTMLKAINAMFSPKSRYFYAQALFDFFRSNNFFPIETKGNIIIIDDLGVEPVSYNNYGEIRYPLNEFLTARYNTNEPTLIATNLSLEEINKRYGDRVFDRLKEMYNIIFYNDPSYRK